jgi:PAS domain S-box-containing protein
MKREINILVLEDSEDDYELSLNYIKMAEFEVYSEVAWTKDQFEKNLESNNWDIILCDYDMPQFNAIDALNVLRDKNIDIPLIVISGSISEELAVSTIKAGAKDYLMKDKLMKLPYAIARALRENKAEKERRFNEKELASAYRKQKALIAAVNTSALLLTVNNDAIIESVNDTFCELTGYSREDLLNVKVSVLDFDNSYEDLICNFKNVSAEHGYFRKQVKIKTKTGRPIWIDLSVTPVNDKTESEGYLLLASDITEQRRAAAEKNSLLNELIVNNQDLEQFNYIISHNLRAPVAKLIGLADILNDQNMDESIRYNVLQTIKDESLQLDQVLKDLTSVTSIRKGIDELLTEVNLSASIDFSLQILKQENEARDFEVIGNIDKNINVKGVESYIKNIFLNILSNAYKFRDPARHLVIHIEACRLDNNNVQLTIKDNGIGFDSDKYKPKLFRLYSKFHHNTQGRGIGLFLAKSKMERMGGAIKISSKPNEGSTITLNFQTWN